MHTLLFGETYSDDTTLSIPLTNSFKQEGEYLKKKRQELIDKDKMGANKLLINNPKRPISLYKPTVLI